jgi:hypothetical protein
MAEWPGSDELCQQVASTTSDSCVLMFSRGKDAVGAWLQLRRFFKRIEPVFLYLCPDLSFEFESLKYYEDYFGQKIHRLPHPSCYRLLNAAAFQTRWGAEAVWEQQLPNFAYRDVQQVIIEDCGLDAITQAAVGVRACDSMMRRVSIKTHGPWSRRKGEFFPIWDWNAERLRQELRAAKVKLPVDYEWFGRSFDGIDRRFTEPLRRHSPADFQKLKAFFPLIEADLKRYEFNGRRHGQKAN